MHKLLFGRYIYRDALIHQLDARFKLIFSIAMIILAMFANTVIEIGMYYMVLCAVVWLSKIPIKIIIKGIKPIIAIIVVTSLLQLFFTTGGKIYFELGWFYITENGVKQAVLMALRLIFIVSFSSLLTLTTTPIAIGQAITFYLKPFSSLIDLTKWSLLITVSIRFIPTLLREIEKLKLAQQARGVRFYTGGIVQRTKALMPIVLPLFVNSYKRAIELGTAMSARGYVIGMQQTQFKIMSWQFKDSISAIIGICIIGLIVYFQI